MCVIRVPPSLRKGNCLEATLFPIVNGELVASGSRMVLGKAGRETFTF